MTLLAFTVLSKDEDMELKDLASMFEESQSFFKDASALQKQADKAQHKEWSGYLKFSAAKIISSMEARDLVTPTRWIDADTEAIFMVLSFDSSQLFQEEKLSRPMLLRQPCGGLLDQIIQPSVRMIAFVPIYGAKDAGRGIWRRARRVTMKNYLRQNM
eukprot:7252741-Heterocapsa_arctica.AAC.1